MRAAKFASALWVLLAVVVFSVTFDWQTRVAGHQFVQSQLLRQQLGEPPITINDGFRPMVRAAAVRSSMWLLLIASAGIAATVVAGRAAK